MSARALSFHMEHGVQLLGRLSERIKPKGKWAPDAWQVILKYLEDEAQFMQEGEAESVYAYALLARLGVVYLTEYPDLRRLHQFTYRISEDMSGLNKAAPSIDVDAMSEVEQHLFHLSLEEIKVVVGELTTSPQTQ